MRMPVLFHQHQQQQPKHLPFSFNNTPIYDQIMVEMHQGKIQVTPPKAQLQATTTSPSRHLKLTRSAALAIEPRKH